MNYYAEAIDILMLQNYSPETLLAEIAKTNPGAVVKAFKSLYKNNWRSEVISLLRAGKKIPAIKLCQELTGMGLKEAKEACEAIRI